MSHAFVLLLVVPTIPALAARPAPVVSSHALLSGNLVEAKVTKVTPIDGGSTKKAPFEPGMLRFDPPYRATFVVTHVYKGAQTLVGKEFDVDQYPAKAFRPVGEPNFAPSLKSGERVLWPLKGGPTPVPYSAFGPPSKPAFLAWYASFPPSDGQNEEKGAAGRWSYGSAISWAKAVEETFKADPAARYGLLKKFATGETLEVVYWAISVLLEVDPRGTLSFLRDLVVQPDVGVWQKVIADEHLATMPEAAWKKSPQRLRLYQSWVRGPLSSADVEQMESALPRLGKDFTADDCWNLMNTVAGRKDLPAAARAAALGDALGSYGRGLTKPESVFEFILGLVAPAEAVEVQRAAAGALRHFPDELRSHQNDVQAARRRIDDKTALKNIDAALWRSSAATGP